MVKARPEVLMAVREQRRLLSELVNADEPPEVEAPRFIPRPRSERHVAFKIA